MIFTYYIEDNANTLSYATFFGGNLAAEHVDGGTVGLIEKVVYQSVCAGCGGFSDFPLHQELFLLPIMRLVTMLFLSLIQNFL